MKDVEHFYQALLQARQEATPMYGDNVMPALRIFSGLQDANEKKTFQNALERMLKSKNADIRSYGVDICLGFFVFRKSI